MTKIFDGLYELEDKTYLYYNRMLKGWVITDGVYYDMFDNESSLVNFDDVVEFESIKWLIKDGNLVQSKT